MNRRTVILLFVIGMLAIGWWTYRDSLSLDAILERETQLREWVQRHPLLSSLTGFAAYIGLSLVPGTVGKPIIYGWLFGFWIAIVIASVGLTIAAVVSMLTVRYVFREWVEKKLSALIRAIDRAIASNGPTYMVFLRLLHAPYTLTNYASGATKISASTFAWTTYVGLLPSTIVFVLAGSQLPSLRKLAEHGVWGVVDLHLLVALSLLALLPLVAKAIQSYMQKPTESPSS